MIRLRPHHLLCTQGFAGMGYDARFTENMTWLVGRLREDPDAEIELVFTTDDLCRCCPHHLGEGICASDGKVLRFDARIVSAFGLREGPVRYHDLVRRIDAGMTPQRLAEICGDCDWFSSGLCEKAVCCPGTP